MDFSSLGRSETFHVIREHVFYIVLESKSFTPFFLIASLLCRIHIVSALLHQLLLIVLRTLPYTLLMKITSIDWRIMLVSHSYQVFLSVDTEI